MENELLEMLLGVEITPKIDEKMFLEDSWEALGCPWSPKGSVQAQNWFYVCAPRTTNCLLERSWEGFGLVLGGLGLPLGSLLGDFLMLLDGLGWVLEPLR